jgi:hypothetical protein
MLLKVIDRDDESTPKNLNKKAEEAGSFTSMVAASYEEDQEKKQKKKISSVKSKIMAIGRMNLMLKKMRENNEELTKIK